MTAKFETVTTGKTGESIAKKYLESKGHRILYKNYHTRYGEIDLISMQDETIYCWEVKYRKNNNFGFGEESISSTKIDKLSKSVEVWISEEGEKYIYEDIFLNAIVIDKDLKIREYEIF